MLFYNFISQVTVFGEEIFPTQSNFTFEVCQYSISIDSDMQYYKRSVTN